MQSVVLFCTMLKSKIFRQKWLAVLWFLIMCILFFLPGSALPQSNWLNDIHFDKIVHIGLFAGLLFLWRSCINSTATKYNWILLFAALIYGILVELIQGHWIPNRSEDFYDVVADMTGSVLGILVWLAVYRKK